MRCEDLSLTVGESRIFGHEQHFERMAVGKCVLKRLVAAIVDTVELFGDIAVTPFVTRQFRNIGETSSAVPSALNTTSSRSALVRGSANAMESSSSGEKE